MHMYTFEGDLQIDDGANAKLKAVALTTEEISLRVFEGEFTYARDAKELVDPMLGLYGLVLKQQNEAHMRAVFAHIKADKGRFFPEKIEFDESEGPEPLFGDLVGILESLVKPEQKELSSGGSWLRMRRTNSSREKREKKAIELSSVAP